MSTERLNYPILEAFELIGVSKSQGYKLIATRKLESFKIGKKARYSTLSQVRACIELLKRESDEQTRNAA